MLDGSVGDIGAIAFFLSKGWLDKEEKVQFYTHMLPCHLSPHPGANSVVVLERTTTTYYSPATTSATTTSTPNIYYAAIIIIVQIAIPGYPEIYKPLPHTLHLLTCTIQAALQLPPFGRMHMWGWGWGWGYTLWKGVSFTRTWHPVYRTAHTHLHPPHAPASHTPAPSSLILTLANLCYNSWSTFTLAQEFLETRRCDLSHSYALSLWKLYHNEGKDAAVEKLHRSFSQHFKPNSKNFRRYLHSIACGIFLLKLSKKVKSATPGLSVAVERLAGQGRESPVLYPYVTLSSVPTSWR
ncbi:hypothetical protein Pelo_18930 [Pelomyxa schiedti]|nr:hypothetical protein Pelo_18930 [Pelomyxa schiedti]